ncbi:MAG TPA: hypothetical protein ENI77_07085 [Nitrospirae bacterium]|nr:hypothetical protein [Nitrospirota bacterium]
MTQPEEEKERSYNILVYGIDKLSLTVPEKSISKSNFVLHFEPYNTPRRFDEFDGVILYQGIFEQFEQESNYSGDYLTHSCDKDELDKRISESTLLLRNGGFICFLLNTKFIDEDGGRSFRDTDLTKYYLRYRYLSRENFQKRAPNLDVILDEFRGFLERYGAATSYFQYHGDSFEIRIISKVSSYVTGMIINRANYFIPTRVPDNRPGEVKEYFTLLANALALTYNKLSRDLPGWINEFEFSEESDSKAERDALSKKISEIDERAELLQKYKSILSLTGGDLVDSVATVFRKGFGIGVDPLDELREDIKLLDDNKPFCLCEVKGTNKGVKRENINQADSHRERSGFKAEFPSLLVMNIKNARSLNEKDQGIAIEQIRHAKTTNVLILRTLDLLELLRLYKNNKIMLTELKEMLTSNAGWLRVDKDGYKIVIDEDGAS